MKRGRTKGGMLLALFLGLGGTAAAATTSDSLTVTITPNAYYAVDVDTSTMLMNLGTVDLGIATHTVSPATVTVQSTYAQTDLTLVGFATTTAGIPWTFDDDTTSTETDKLAAWAVFTDTSVFAAPTQGSGGAFSGSIPAQPDSDVISAATQDVGNNGIIDRRFVLDDTTAGYRSMEDIPSSASDLAASRSKLWLYFRLPPSSTSSTAQRVTITLTAGVPN